MREQKEKYSMHAVFWGTRGSGAAAGKEFLVYGGNSSCVSVETEDTLFVFDAGTGIIQLGKELQNKNYSGEIHLFLSHLHLDHIQGLPSFSPVFNPKTTLHIYGKAFEGSEKGETLHTQLSRVLGPPYWPVSPEQYRAQVIWHELEECCGGTAAAGDGWQMKALEACHPNGSLLYRLETSAGSVVYGMDCELPESFQESYASFCRKTDLLIFDGTYDEAEYAQVKGYGHATWQQAVEMADRSEAKRVLISHHKWDRTDKELEVLEKKAAAAHPSVGYARDGMKAEI